MLIVLLLAQATSAQPNLIRDDFTPRELYVSCSLALANERLEEDKDGSTFKAQAPATCAAAALKAISIAIKQSDDSVLKFCPVGQADYGPNLIDTVATTYMRFYEDNAVKLNSLSGYAALFMALKAKWPCN